MDEIINIISDLTSREFTSTQRTLIIMMFEKIRDYCNEPGLNENDIKDFLNKICEI